jgi:DNA-binding MarR family transcriptional regulator
MRAFPDDAEPDSDEATRSKLDSIQEQLDDLRARLLAHPTNDAVDAATLGQLAREIVRSRRRRARVFGQTGLFGEPAWDILLGLYVAAEAQQRLNVSAVCELSGVPQSTALRWLEKLERDGWVRRDPDPLDRRRSWMLLTERASNLIRAYLTEIRLRPDQE